MIWRDEAGTAALTTILLLPVLIVVTAAILDLGALRFVAGRVRAAADLAVLVAVNDQDDAELARSGRIRLAADVVAVAREYLATNLTSTAGWLAEDPQAIAAAAEVSADHVQDGGPDDHMRPVVPAVRLRVDVPVRTPRFAAIGLPAITTVRVEAAAAAR